MSRWYACIWSFTSTNPCGGFLHPFSVLMDPGDQLCCTICRTDEYWNKNGGRQSSTSYCIQNGSPDRAEWWLSELKCYPLLYQLYLRLIFHRIFSEWKLLHYSHYKYCVSNVLLFVRMVSNIIKLSSNICSCLSLYAMLETLKQKFIVDNCVPCFLPKPHF